MVQNPDSHKPFTDEEEEKLLDSLEINRNELNVLLHAAIVILTQVSWYFISGTRMWIYKAKR